MARAISRRVSLAGRALAGVGLVHESTDGHAPEHPPLLPPPPSPAPLFLHQLRHLTHRHPQLALPIPHCNRLAFSLRLHPLRPGCLARRLIPQHRQHAPGNLLAQLPVLRIAIAMQHMKDSPATRPPRCRPSPGALREADPHPDEEQKTRPAHGSDARVRGRPARAGGRSPHRAGNGCNGGIRWGCRCRP